MRRAVGLSVLAVAVSSCAGRGREHLGRGGTGGAGPEVRVLLRKVVPPFDLSVEGPAEIVVGGQGGATQFEESPAGRVTFSQGRVVWGTRALAGGTVRIRSTQGGTIRINSVEYPGAIELLPESGRVINGISMERYLAGVLFGEMYSDWPDAALRAQAIASRTYALYHLRRRERAEDARPYDVDDSERSQVYRPDRILPKAWRIVGETAGLVLIFRGQLFETFFHSTCGGHTAPVDQVFDYALFSALAGVPCPYCANTPHATWRNVIHETLLRKALDRRVRQAGITLGRIEAIEPVRREVGALYADYFRIVHERGSFEIKAEVFRSALSGVAQSPLKSVAVDEVRRSPDGAFEFVGRGWGHGIGLCQYGAREMARRGCSYLEILTHYYPGATLARAW
ncbi:MAG: SpoIID/LytB domain-containing protein [Planctomycetes bacterium]|nr:SpoIID/LytB domain-containing protein [Planctomycetota bacterium]